MKKQILSVITAMLFSGSYLVADIGVGITANMSSVETSGSETLRHSSKVTNGSHDESVLLPEIFIEAISDIGTFGISYIPVQEMGTKTRSDTNSDGDTGSYKAEAELENHIMLYTDLNLGEAYGQTFYVKAGVSIATIATSEALNSGSTYGNDDVFGFTGGLGFKADLGSNLYYKVEGTYTEYDTYNGQSTADNKVEADTDIYSGKVSLGYKF